MNLQRPLSCAILAAAAVCALTIPAAQGQDTRQLILKTQPDDTVIELTASVSILPDGNIEAHPVDLEACSAPAGQVSCDDVTVGDLQFNVNDLSIVEVAEGSVLSMSWSSRGAWSCAAGGDLPGWNATDLPPDSRDATLAQRTVNTAGLASETPYVASLICTNGPVASNDGQEQSVDVSVASGGTPDPGLPQRCSNSERQPPPGWTRLSTGAQTCLRRSNYTWNTDADCRFWEDGIWPNPFPSAASNGQTRRLALGRFSGREYLAIEFSTAGLSPTAVGQLAIEAPQAGIHSARKIITISECPGDFNQAAIESETGCYEARFVGSSQWGGSATSRSCKLQSNRTYFLNVLYTESPVGTPTNQIEPHSQCGPTHICGNTWSPSH